MDFKKGEYIRHLNRQSPTAFCAWLGISRAAYYAAKKRGRYSKDIGERILVLINKPVD